MSECYLRYFQLLEELFFRLIVIDISVVFYNEKVIIPAFCHIVLVFKLRKAFGCLEFSIQTVQSIVGLYP